MQSRCRLAGFTKKSTITLCFDIPFKLKKKLLYNTIYLRRVRFIYNGLYEAYII
nr:MAG TPA: hypothetical protein [Caudoviricetes sp.]